MSEEEKNKWTEDGEMTEEELDKVHAGYPDNNKFLKEIRKKICDGELTVEELNDVKAGLPPFAVQERTKEGEGKEEEEKDEM